jgi:fibro-slime domain-containing protein
MKTSLSCCTLSILLLSACGRSPAVDTDTDSGTGTDGPATVATNTLSTTGTDGSVSDSDSPTDTGGTVSNGQTDTGDTTVSTTTPVTVTDTDPTVTASATETTGPLDTSVGESSSSGESLSVADTSTTDGTDTTDGDTSTSGDTSTTGTTDTGDDTTTDNTTGEEVQCGLQLKVTIRDFQFSHPDMEDYCCGQVNGLVQANLGPNNKPVFAMVGNPQMLTDSPTFDQWYTDVPNVNQATTINIDLMEIMPGVYSYSNNAFFPIDNMLFGNEGQVHNYHFTTEIHTKFQYNGGETFTFSGDDDVWVFVDKKLAIDIGGVHGPSQKSVNIDNLGLTIGNTYFLDVFHAERHTVDSNFRIDTTICSSPQ